MKIHRFIIDTDLKSLKINIKERTITDQIRKVLRMKTGEKIKLSNGRGKEVLAEIVEINSRSIDVCVLEGPYELPQNKNEVNLYGAILKRSNFELVVQKATEVGVTRIIPIVTNRTVKLNLNLQRLSSIAREAAEQSGRGYVPEISGIVSLEGAAKLAGQNSFNMIFDESGRGLAYNQQLTANREQKPDTERVKIGIWVGPEGGWTEEELNLARKNDFRLVSLGNFTMRA
ncbi:MAG: RsmE family RNA methyltransferase [Candidatus Dojkabacteria bacterium]|nr:RsmE family RNA methyltransferase [Candidatus Dojkabacteria bacterium]